MRALDQGTSVNQVLREYLERYAGDSRQAAALQRFFELADESGASSGAGGRTWKREDLYDRPVLRDRTNLR